MKDGERTRLVLLQNEVGAASFHFHDHFVV